MWEMIEKPPNRWESYTYIDIPIVTKAALSLVLTSGTN